MFRYTVESCIHKSNSRWRRQLDIIHLHNKRIGVRQVLTKKLINQAVVVYERKYTSLSE